MAYHDVVLTYEEYMNITNRFSGAGFILPYFIVYLRTDPKLCFQRMKERNRSEEKSKFRLF
jgi:deoxyadenosine/deoxycytidine kinase